MKEMQHWGYFEQTTNLMVHTVMWEAVTMLPAFISILMVIGQDGTVPLEQGV